MTHALLAYTVIDASFCIVCADWLGSSADMCMSVRYSASSSTSSPGEPPRPIFFDLLNDAQIGYEVKRRVHEAVRRDPVGALGQAPALGVEGPLLSALTELVLATRT